MSNNYFRFKQFTVFHDRCAMKVNTDSCILGAIADHPDPAHILDIGTGSGLLALMMAQRFSKAVIDAVEPDRKSFGQALENVERSPWADRIRLHNLDIQEFSSDNRSVYDMILSNPPWYCNHQRSPDENKNTARHLDRLSWDILSSVLPGIIARKGIFYIILPPHPSSAFGKSMMKYGFKPVYETIIITRQGKVPLRVIKGYRMGIPGFAQKKLIIQHADGKFTHDFKSLLKDFYLDF